ncbi:MAG: autotransporter domain-containing protein [Elusimicrobia bacterium]|nr:autotransporter domain-containing protein [Elusimicrobiota bacterium]
MKIIRLLSLWTALGALVPPGALAAAGAPNYNDATTIALQHANSPADWVPTDGSIVKITGVKATDHNNYGITYVNGDTNIIVRSLAYAYRYNKVGSYTTFSSFPNAASWVTTGNDATRFLLDNGVTGANVTALMERGLGMQDSGVHDAMIEYALAPNNDILMRPSKDPDIANYFDSTHYGTSAPFNKPAAMSAGVYANFQTYYNNWVRDTLVVRSSTFPFSELGYTYFWGNGYTLPQIKGMSEFIIPGGTAVDIYGIYATQSYIYTRNDGSVFSSAAGSQYGNGFASFDITGTCDSVWAGHRFQKNIRSGATPNQIIVENTGSVSGGSGLLVWSLNYDVTNNGSITGATSNKFNIAGTSNIGILFQGDTSLAYGTPLAGINKLTNNGTISSPGTAVQAAAGDTAIINNPGGTISGGNYAILTGAGNDTVTLHGGLVSGKVDLGGGTNALTVDGATQLGFTLDPNTKGTAQVANPGTVNISNDKLTLSPSVTGNVVNGDTFLIVDATALTADTSKITVQNDPSHPMLTFTLGKAGNQLSLTATRDNSFYSSGSGNPSLGAVLDSLASSASGDMAAVLAALDGSGGAANARQLQPGVDNGGLAAVQQTQGQFLGTVMGHLEGLGSGAASASSVSGAAAGGAAAAELDPAVWSQGIGTYMHQSPRGQSNGYAASIYGWSGGYDTEVRPGLILGVGAGYAHDLVRSADSGGRSDVDSYQGSGYGGLTGDTGYVNGLLSIAHNRYDSSRQITFGGLARTALSSYNGRQYTGYAEGGFFRERYGLKLTPLASLQYTHLRTDAYSETGAGAADLSVDAQDYDLLESGLGFKLAYPVRARLGELSPDFHARWLYDLVAQSQQATATFAGGGPSFTTGGFTPARSSFDLGAKLALTLKQTPRRALTVALNYDLQLKTDFYSHSGSVNLRYSF